MTNRRKKLTATGCYAKRLEEIGDVENIAVGQPARQRLMSQPNARAGVIDIWKKRPQPCAYGCGRSVYTIYAVAMCNICRKQHGIPIWNE